MTDTDRRIRLPEDLDDLDFDKLDGLVPVVAQNADSGTVLMVAFSDREALSASLATGELQQRYAPKLGFMQWGYRYGILPLYTVFPKPGELDKTLDWLLSGRKTTAPTGSSTDLTAARQTLHPWAPVWSSFAFAVVVLAVGCVYIEYREF